MSKSTLQFKVSIVSDPSILMGPRYRTYPPFTRLASRILLAMELTRELIFLIGMWLHSCCKAAVSSWMLLETRRCDRTCLLSSSHMCSVGERSGCKMVKSSGITLVFAKKSRQTRATCGLTLKYQIGLLHNGTTY